MLLIISISVIADPINTMGTWNPSGVRSLAPPSATNQPVASVDGNVLSISSPVALSNLLVTVMNRNGVIVYQEYITFSGTSLVCDIIMPTQHGEYQLTMSHPYGILTGYFIIY